MTETKSWDPIWEEIFQRQEWGKYPPEHVIRFVARRFYKAPDRAAVRLLDLGCGTGACTWYMAREGFAVSGIDGSPSGLRKATACLAQEGHSADLRTGDFVQLPWPDDYFDGVIDNAALYSNRFAECQRVCDEVLRVLKPGGYFQSANFSDCTWGYGLGEQVEENGFINIPEGPLQGRGFALFFGQAQLEELFRRFTSVSMEKTSWTADSLQKLVELWIVEARKPQP